MTELVEQVASYHSATLECTELLRAPFLSQLFVEAACMPRCSILYTCDHESEWNT